MKKLVASPFLPTPESYPLDLGRAQQLYGARRYTDARKAFDALRVLAKGPDRTVISLRLAECDYGLRRYAAARDGLRAYLDQKHDRRRRGPVLLHRDDARARTRRRVCRGGAGLRRSAPRGAGRRGHAQRPGQLLHPSGRRREGRGRLRPARSALSDGAARGPRRVEGRVVGLPQRRLRDDDQHVPDRGRAVAPLGLPPDVAVLDRARPGGVRRSRRRAPDLPRRRERLPELLLRPRSRPRPGAAARGARAPVSARARVARAPGDSADDQRGPGAAQRDADSRAARRRVCTTTRSPS